MLRKQQALTYCYGKNVDSSDGVDGVDMMMIMMNFVYDHLPLCCGSSLDASGINAWGRSLA
jgi:hypothetical protein